MAFNEEKIIQEKQIIIDNLVTWIYEHTENEEDFKRALRHCYIDESDIEGYCE
jgi:hypothetical protein